jgi:lysophospholipase L1-like esterase
VVGILAFGEVAVRIAELVAPAPADATSAPALLPDLPGTLRIGDLDAPGLRAIYEGALYETNRFGLRGPEISEKKGDGVFRIAVIGDSITAGHGVAFEDTYAARIEAALNARNAGRRYEVLDLGLPGLNALGSVNRLASHGLRLEPDLIVYGFTLNDIQSPSYREMRGDFRTFAEAARSERVTSPSALWRWLAPRFASLRELVAPPEGSYVHELDYNYFENPPALASFEASLNALAQLARRSELCVHILIHTKLYYLHRLHPFRRHYDAVEAIALADGFTVTQSLPGYYGMRAPPLWVGPLDTHPNAQAHAVLAERLLDGLDGLPEPCFDARRPRRAP